MTRVETRIALLVLFSVMTVALSGCLSRPDRPPMGRVSGVVTYNGEPLKSGSVIFTQAGGPEGSGRVASGRIQSNGTFYLTTFDQGDGAVVGEHVVTIEARGMGEDFKMANQMKDESGKMVFRPMYRMPKSLVPAKYSTVSSSPLRATVEPGSNRFEFNLTDD